jgi:hypothetical protein
MNSNTTPTPLQVELSNPDNALKFFNTIKHTRLEGLIFEHEFDQIFPGTFEKAGWKMADALVLRRVTKKGNEEFLLYAHTDTGPERQLFKALKRTGIPVRQLRIIDGELHLRHDENGEPLGTPEIIPLVSNSNSEVTNKESIDERRIWAGYWGFANHLGKKFEIYARDMVIKDMYVGPQSKYLWDLDRFFISKEDEVLFIETKHKYPTGALQFGMNLGEVAQAKMLLQAGFRSWHVILVKPRWEKSLSSMYLFYDREARENALWIAGNMSSETFFSAGQSRMASADTSLYARERIKFLPLSLSEFNILGKNSQPSKEIAANFLRLVNGETLTQLDHRTLLAHKI